MSILVWNPAWETHLEPVDSQHRELFRRMEAVAQAIDHSNEADEIANTIVYLSGYIDIHFGTEEALMVRSGFPGLEMHRSAHRGLQERVALLLQELDREEGASPDDFLEFLVDWLINHIDTYDRALALHVHRMGPPAPARNEG
jgi:hemerythrin